MKGSKGLASKFYGRRCRTANSRRRRVRGRFCLRALEIAAFRKVGHGGDCARPEGRGMRRWLGGSDLSSDVTDRVKAVANPGAAAAAGMVAGARDRVSRVIETPQRGSGAQVGAG